MPSTPYQVGETVDISLRGATIRDVGNNFLDIKTADGEEMCIVFPDAEGIEVTRRGPAGGVQPSDVWEDSRGNTWFAILHEHRYGADVVKLTRDGLTTYPVEMVHKDYVLTKRLFRAEPEPGQVEPEPAAPVRIDSLFGQIKSEEITVSHPDWNGGQPVLLTELHDRFDARVDVTYGVPETRDYVSVTVAADTLVTPYGGAQ